MMASDWYKIRPYKALATELNQTLGGGFKISYNWRCELESSNCPSARLLKDVNFKDNDEAKQMFDNYMSSMKLAGYDVKGISVCEPRAGFTVYCSFTARKGGKTVTIDAKSDFVGIDIQS